MTDPFDHEGEIPQLRTLPQAIAPGSVVEDAVVAALNRKGFLRRSRSRRSWLAVAAVLIAFVGGIWVGRGTAPAPREEVAASRGQATLTVDAPGTTVTWF